MLDRLPLEIRRHIYRMEHGTPYQRYRRRFEKARFAIQYHYAKTGRAHICRTDYGGMYISMYCPVQHANGLQYLRRKPTFLSSNHYSYAHQLLQYEIAPRLWSY